jgi:Carboxypeptidase regulatory-like domain/TonB-dependent Receptor Plug Domain
MKCVPPLVLALSAALFAQDTGVVTGTISDSTGASIVNAEVKLSNAERGIDRKTVSNSVGAYAVGGLSPGAYKLTVTASGFQPYTSVFVLQVAEKIRADATLQLPTANSAITVQGDITHVGTQASDLAGTLTRKEITELQLNGRNFTQLIALVPGVSNFGQQDEGAVGVLNFLNFSINGGRTEYNNWEVDGGDIMDNGSNATLNVYPSIDAISEVRVLVSNYGAQYGRNASGTIEVETKSGTSHFHGNIYEFVRNDMFNARNYFDPPGPPPAYKKNDFGYTLGGPIYIPGIYNTKGDSLRR